MGEIRFFCPRYFCHISSIREYRFFTIGKIDRETGVLPIVAAVAILDSQRFLDRLDFFPRYAWVISVGFTARNHRCIHFFSNVARRTLLASVSSIYSNGLSVNPWDILAFGFVLVSWPLEALSRCAFGAWLCGLRSRPWRIIYEFWDSNGCTRHDFPKLYYEI